MRGGDGATRGTDGGPARREWQAGTLLVIALVATAKLSLSASSAYGWGAPEWTLVAAALAAVGAVCTVALSLFQMDRASRREALHERPWLVLARLAATQPEEGLGPLEVDLQLTNVGRGPALDVEVVVQVFLEVGERGTQIESAGPSELQPFPAVLNLGPGEAGEVVAVAPFVPVPRFRARVVLWTSVEVTVSYRSVTGLEGSLVARRTRTWAVDDEPWGADPWWPAEPDVLT